MFEAEKENEHGALTRSIVKIIRILLMNTGKFEFDWSTLFDHLTKSMPEQRYCAILRLFEREVTDLHFQDCSLLSDLLMLKLSYKSWRSVQSPEQVSRWLSCKSRVSIDDLPFRFSRFFFQTQPFIVEKIQNYFDDAVITGNCEFLAYWLGCGGSIWSQEGPTESFHQCIEVVLSSRIYEDASLLVRSRRRINIVMKVLKLYMYMYSGHFHVSEYSLTEDLLLNRRITCMRTMFEAIPEPYVTSQEICDFMNEVRNFYHDNTLKLNDGFLRHYESHFPESKNPFAPRSLQHLSRCVIRERLKLTRYLPDGVYQLGLEKFLQDYILCIQSYNANTKCRFQQDVNENY